MRFIAKWKIDKVFNTNVRENMLVFYNQIKTPTLLPLLVVLACYLSIGAVENVAYVSKGITFLLMLVSYISAKRFNENCKKIYNLLAMTSWLNRFVILIAFAYFNFSVYGIVFVEGLSGFDIEVYPKFFYYVVISLVWTSPTFIQLIAALDGYMSHVNLEECKGIPFKVKILAFVLLMINYILWIYAFNPCITSPDSCYLFYQAHVMGSEPMTNWHPPFYAIILSVLLKICDSVTFLIYVQCISFAILLIQILDYLKRKDISYRYLIIFYILTGFAFNNVIQMVTLWKDIPYMISILWLTFTLIKIITNNDKITVFRCVELFISLLFTSFFRQNGILPAVGTIVSLGVYVLWRKRYRLIIPLVIFVASYMLISGPLYDYYQVKERPGLKYFALANDIVGTYYECSESLDEVIEMVNEITGNDPDNFPYNPYYTKYNSNALGNYSVGEFLGIYIKTFLDHPKMLVRELMRRNTVIWSILRPNNEPAGCVNYTSEYHSDSYTEYVYDYRDSNWATKMLTTYSGWLTDTPTIYVFAWRTGIYTLVLILIFGLIFLRKKYDMLIPFVPIFFNILALFVSSGWTDYRYYWPTEIVFFLILPFSKMANKENKN